MNLVFILSTPVRMRGGLICITLRASVRSSARVCETYIVHYLNGTGLCWALVALGAVNHNFGIGNDSGIIPFLESESEKAGST